MNWDVFISYASEDRRLARGIARGLTNAGLTVWFDDFSLEAGDSLRRSIDRGLRDSAYGVVILSPRFFQKEWPQRELDGLTSREDGSSKVILPVWYELTPEEVRNYSPPLGDKVSILYNGSVKAVVTKLLRAIHRDRLRERGWEPASIHLSSGAELVVLPIRPRFKRALCLGRYPVTNSEYERFVRSVGHREPLGEKYSGDEWVGPFEPWTDARFNDPSKPVVCVDFWDAASYCSANSQAEETLFVPPTDLWDFAALEALPGGDLIKALRRMPPESIHDQATDPAPVARDRSRDNALGLSDLFGNVWEWCAALSDEYLSERWDFALVMPEPPPPEPELRGGGFLDNLQIVRPQVRSGLLEERDRTRHTDVGFRVAALVDTESLPAGLLSLIESLPDALTHVWDFAQQPARYMQNLRNEKKRSDDYY